jgi:LysM repeat protein
MSNVYIVAKGDTLSKISKLTGVSIAELKILNKLPDPNKLKIGQKIHFKKEDVLGFRALILDKDRNPIKELTYQFEFAGRLIKGTTGPDGLTKKIMTQTPEDQVRILLQRLDTSLKEVAVVPSGYGNKLVTLVSPSIKVEAKTEPHPNVNKGELPKAKEKVVPIHDPKTKQSPTTEKKDLGITAKPTKTPDGKPLVKVEGDIPDVSFLGDYVGGEVTNQDIEDAAKDLKCEPGLVYAIAKQESAHSSFIKLGDRKVPAILYERHQFSRRTSHKYSAKYPDISLPTGYYNAKSQYVQANSAYKKSNNIPDDVAYYRPLNKKDTKETKDGALSLKDMLKQGVATEAKDKYVSGVANYKRLAKAYQLDKVAALESCSWGKFQIMGFNYKTAGYSTVQEFVKGMSIGEPQHINAFLKFAKSNPTLLSGLRNKDFEKIAEGHNGTSWKSINPHYASNIEKFYKEYGEKK